MVAKHEGSQPEETATRFITIDIYSKARLDVASARPTTRSHPYVLEWDCLSLEFPFEIRRIVSVVEKVFFKSCPVVRVHEKSDFMEHAVIEKIFRGLCPRRIAGIGDP